MKIGKVIMKISKIIKKFFYKLKILIAKPFEYISNLFKSNDYYIRQEGRFDEEREFKLWTIYYKRQLGYDVDENSLKSIEGILDDKYDWENDVKTKYGYFNKKELKRFIEYLKYLKIKEDTSIDLYTNVQIGMLASVLASVILDFAFGGNISQQVLGYIKTNIDLFITIIIIAFFIWLIAFKVIPNFLISCRKNRIKKMFYDDLIKIIENIISEKG